MSANCVKWGSIVMKEFDLTLFGTHAHYLVREKSVECLRVYQIFCLYMPWKMDSLTLYIMVFITANITVNQIVCMCTLCVLTIVKRCLL